jgi:hypothetical protein
VALVGLGDVDGAFAALDRAAEDRDPAVASVGVDPRFEPLRAEARYTSLAARLGVQ